MSFNHTRQLLTVCLLVVLLSAHSAWCEEMKPEFENQSSKASTKNRSKNSIRSQDTDEGAKEIYHLNNGTLEDNLRTICRLLDIRTADDCNCSVLLHKYNIDYCTVHTVDVPIQHAGTVCHKSSIRMVETVTIAIISFLGIVGNILVLVVRVRNWKLSLHYQLISGLAMADLAFSCIFLIISFPFIWLCKWPFGSLLCTLMKTLLSLSSNIDLGFILIIAIERYIGIVHPFTGGASACKIYALICANLVAGFFTALPFFFVYKVDNYGLCDEDWSMFSAKSSLVYGWLANVIFFLIPVCVTGVLYYQSLRTLKSTLFRREMMLTLDEVSRKKLVSENKRILRIIWTILLAFFFLVGPNHISWFIIDNFTISERANNFLFTISAIAYALHTSINPIIYSIIDRKFRKNVYYLIRNGRRRKSFSTIVTGMHCATPVHQIAANNAEVNSLTSSHIEYIDSLC